MRLATSCGSSDRDSVAAHVQQLAQLAGQAAASATQAGGTGEGRRRLVARGSSSSRRSSSSNWSQAELGQGDDADQLLVVPHRHDEHRLVDDVGALDRLAARVGLDVIDPLRRPVLGDPAREPLADLRAQDREVDLLVRADPALEGDRDEVVRRLEEVDAGVVVVDDPPRLLDDRPARPPRASGWRSSAGRRAGARAAARPGAPRPQRARPTSGAGCEERAADRQVQHDDEVLDRPGRLR